MNTNNPQLWEKIKTNITNKETAGTKPTCSVRIERTPSMFKARFLMRR